MGKESVVEIGGHRYRYVYEPSTQKTTYDGPVGDAPALSEAEFLAMAASGEEIFTPEELVAIEFDFDQAEEISSDAIQEVLQEYSQDWRKRVIELDAEKQKMLREHSERWDKEKQKAEKEKDMKMWLVRENHLAPIYDSIFAKVSNDEHWKRPTKPVRVYNSQQALIVRSAITNHLGGTEMKKHPDGGFVVTSKGYYHYVGA